MFPGAKFHFVSRVNGKKYVTEIPVKQLQMQLFRMELEEVDAVMKEINFNPRIKILLEIETGYLGEVMKPIQTRLKNERYVEEHHG